MDEFETVAEVIFEDVLTGNGEHEPVADSTVVQTPVPFNRGQKLLWHNENSFNQRWPLLLMFSPTVVATSGGQTPLTDSREMLKVLDPKIVELFRERGIAYIRRFGDGIGLPWQKIFGTESPAELECRTKAEGIELLWGEERKLTTKSVRPAIVEHPLNGELAWFGQPAHWHRECLDEETREALIDVLGADNLPRDCTFGDGTAIADSIMEEIVAAYESIEYSFDWVVGDVLIVDNVLTSHARNAYEGPRRLMVAMGDRCEFADGLSVETRRIA
ncbi:hypothetical protein BJF87_13650 [Gordonia sp. CNJ-863]|nr:hypothetical protein BJF87_13650 [Gordonia sp. CNJ-863]